MSGLLRRTKRLQRQAAASTDYKRKLDWLRSFFGHVKADTKPPEGFFKGRENLEQIFFEKDENDVKH